MSLFSKLFKDEKAEKAATDLLKGLFSGVLKEEPAQTAPENTFADQAPVQHVQQTAAPAAAPSGFSWGETMPAEENQFNYPGTYVEYFDGIFRTEFPAYVTSHTPGYGGRSTVFTLTAGGQTALTVELLSENSSSVKLRENCAKRGIPYLRFYYDHHGWWNTRSYVIARTRAALGL